MRASIIAILAILAVAVLLALHWHGMAAVRPRANRQEVGPSRSQAASASPQAAPPASSSSLPLKGDFSEAAGSELLQMRVGVTLREFTRSHPGEQPRPFGAIKDPDLRFARFGDYCALAIVNIPLDSGTVLERVAAFYLPPMPSPVGPPAAKDPAEMIGDCVLGAVYLRAPVPRANDADDIAAKLMTSLSSRLGTPERFPHDTHFAIYAWRHAMQWRSGDVTVGAGYDLYKTKTTDLPSFAAFAYVPVFDAETRPDLLEVSRAWWLRADLSRKADANFVMATETAALDASATAAITDVYRSGAAANAAGARNATTQEAHRLTEDDVISSLRQWLTGVEKLPAQRRAAVFLAAYYVVNASETALGNNPPIIKRLDQLGSAYWKAVPGQEEDSRRRWLALAFNLEPEGPIGDAIVLEQMSRGCYFEGLYAENTPLFELVIAQGEGYLTRAHTPAESVLAKLFLASAYEDLVFVASGGMGDVDPSPYKARLAEARAKALEYYTAAFNFAPNSVSAQIAWRQSWRLLANLPPRNIHYFCYSGD